MKIALLQDEIYLPSLAGGIKGNRGLLEGLAHAGHSCLALTRALTSSPDGPNNLQQFDSEMKSRQISIRASEPGVFAYRYQNVDVEAIDLANDDARQVYLVERIQSYRPDWVLVADDKRRFMLASAMRARPGRVVPLIQTIMQLPFGPLSVDRSESQTRLMREVGAIVVISRFVQDYIRIHAGLESHVLRLPVYGNGPFPILGRFDEGCITLINPCALKGLAIFLALAQACPQFEFAAVPTWGATDLAIEQLKRQPNVRILDAVDDIELILNSTRVLLVPSLWPETFGYVVPEAMLRGIPVLASDLGGLPEAKLEVEYLLPVTAAVRRGCDYVCPPQDIRPWHETLLELLGDSDVYWEISRKSRQAALQFVATTDVCHFESFLNGIETSLGLGP